MPEGMIPGPDEAERLIRIAERLRGILSGPGWRGKVPRGDALCACVVLVGSEAGYETAQKRDEFVARIAVLVGWAWDLGAAAKKLEPKGDA